MVFYSSMGVVGSADTRLSNIFSTPVRVHGSASGVSNRGLYRSNVWVNVSVNLLARGVAKTPLKVFQDTPDGTDRIRLRGRGKDPHALARLIDQPWKGGTQFRLKNAMVVEYLLNPEGVAYAWMDREGRASGVPKRLIPMRHDQVTAQYKADGSIGFYEWRQNFGSDPIRILPDDVWVVGFEDHVSPLEALKQSLEIDIASQQTTASFYANGAQVGNVLTTEKQLKPDAVEQLEDQLQSDHKGPQNAFRTLLLANLPGAQFHKGAMSSTDAQTVEHRKLAREEVLAGFHVPQPMGGVLDNATYSNIETQTRMWVVDSLGEHFAMLESAFNGQIVDAHDEWLGCFVEFDPGEILRGDPAKRADTYLKWLMSGTRTVNELRKLENLPPIKDAWADAVWVPQNLFPVGLPGGVSGTPGQPGTAGAPPDVAQAQIMRVAKMLTDAVALPDALGGDSA